MSLVPTFPLPKIPTVNWGHGSGVGFGAQRVYWDSRGNKISLLHGACDLIAKAGTKVLAVADGVVIRRLQTPYPFAHYEYKEQRDKNGNLTQHACVSDTFAIDVQHENFIARYGEIAEELPAGVGAGARVTQGQHIASVGLQCGGGGILGAGSMLHFELFQNANDTSILTLGPDVKYLYVRQGPYYRRKDLLDPTLYLYMWAAADVSGVGATANAVGSVAESLGL